VSKKEEESKLGVEQERKEGILWLCLLDGWLFVYLNNKNLVIKWFIKWGGRKKFAA